jgi:hypothetical protein
MTNKVTYIVYPKWYNPPMNWFMEKLAEIFSHTTLIKPVMLYYRVKTYNSLEKKEE